MLHIGGCGGGLLSSIVVHGHRIRIAWILVGAIVDADAAFPAAAVYWKREPQMFACMYRRRWK